MEHKIQPSDTLYVNQGWNAVIVFDGKVHSVNMLKGGFVEIRYVLHREQDFIHNKLDPSFYGVTFDQLGYAFMENPVL